MKKNKFFLIIGFLWELFHTTFFVYFAVTMIPSESVLYNYTVSSIVFLSSGALLIPVGYLFLLYDDNKFYQIIQILRIGKILALIVQFLIVVYEFIGGNIGSAMIDLLFIQNSVLFVILIIIIFDLILLYFLLSYKKDREIISGEENQSFSPEFTVTEVKVETELKEGADNENPTNSQW